MSCSDSEEGELGYYSKEESLSESPVEERPKKRAHKSEKDRSRKERKHGDRKAPKRKERERRREEGRGGRHRTKEKHRERRREASRRERKRRRTPSPSCSGSYYDEDEYYSPSPSRGRGGAGRDVVRRVELSARDSPRERGGRDDWPRNYSQVERQGGYASFKDGWRTSMPEGSKMTLEQACEAAGRGITTGNTTVEDDVRVYGPDEEEVRRPEMFESFDIKGFPREIRDALKGAGFPSPSQIQAYCWPLGLRGRDVIGIAATGSGKTLAFLLPAFAAMIDEGLRPERDGPGLLVISPTRELAQQIDAEATRFGKAIGMRSVAMYGGQPKGMQLSKYKSGVHTIVGCPGRVNDFLEGGQIRLEHTSRLVLDEADRLLDMGFEPQIKKVLAKLQRKRHTLFFTATWPKDVRQLASEILHKPFKVMIGNREELKSNEDITQLVRVVDARSKDSATVDVLREAGLTNRDSHGKCLVFCNTKRMCEQLSNYLYRYGLPCASIHGDKDQPARDHALNGLKEGRIKILVATDVAARGLDIKGIGLVINYDPANNTEDYVHRIGRTGRAGAKGFSITLLTDADAPKARGIIEVMERTEQEVPHELKALAGEAKGGGRKIRGKGKGKWKGRDRSRSVSF